MHPLSRLLLVACLLCAPDAARADDVAVAVAANFLGTLEKLAPMFEKSSGHKLRISPGATGQLYAQIKAGAPHDVFMSGDAERTKQLTDEGLGLAETRFVYAVGTLVLWSPKPGVIDAKGAVLARPGLGKLALADPALAPYGAAARQVLERLALWDELARQRKLVLGASVAQVQQFASSGNASCGFIALSQVLASKQRGSYWRVPEQLYTQLSQEAVLLKSNKPAARAFLAWLARDPQALATIRAAGYSLPPARPSEGADAAGAR